MAGQRQRFASAGERPRPLTVERHRDVDAVARQRTGMAGDHSRPVEDDEVGMRAVELCERPVEPSRS